jgi:hypothetical protein
MTVIVAALIGAAALTPLREAYHSARAYERGSFRYAAPAAARLTKVRELFAALGRGLAPGAPPAALVARAREAGLELVHGSDEAGELWIVREPAGRRGGDGLYALRPGGFPVCVQAPHTFFDEGTGDVAVALFRTLGASCLSVNTVHRREVDVAHAEASVFLAATEGLVAGARWPIVQVHGFGKNPAVPAGVVAVVSEGTRTPRLALRLQALLSRDHGRVLLFPRDTRALGATTNREGHCARAAGVGFLHLEMSMAWRRTLRTEVAPLARVLREALKPP